MAQKKVTFNEKSNRIPVGDNREEKIVAEDVNELMEVINDNSDDAESRITTVEEEKSDKPSSAVEGNIPVFDTGKSVVDSGKTFESGLTSDPDKIPNSETVKAIEERVSINEADIDNLESNQTSIESRVAVNEDGISSLGGRVSTNEVDIETLFNSLNGYLPQGTIDVASDFPTLGAVQAGWLYEIGTNVTDNDPTKTNTGQSFLAGVSIVWAADGSWIDLGSNYVTTAQKNKIDVGSNFIGSVTPSTPAITGVFEGAEVLPLEDGTYPNQGGLIRDKELCVFVYESATWVKKIFLNSDSPLLPIINGKAIIVNNGEIAETGAGTTSLTITWDQTIFVFADDVGGFSSIPANSITLENAFDFAYIDVNVSDNSNTGLKVGIFGTDEQSNTTEGFKRIIIFVRDNTNYARIAYSAVDFLTKSQTDKLNYNNTYSVISNGAKATREITGTTSIKVTWSESILTFVDGVGKYSLTAPGTITLPNAFDFAYIDVNVVDFGNSGVQLGTYNTTSLKSPTGFKRVVLFARNNITEIAHSSIPFDYSDKLEIVVDKLGTGDALTIAAGLDLYKDGMKLIINEGIYEEYALDFPDNIEVIGVGAVEIRGELLSSATTTEIDNTSTIDANESVIMKNITVTAKNMRYPIHADFSSGKSTKTVTNCKFIHYGNSEAYQYRVDNALGTEAEVFRAMSAWGGGTSAGDIINIDGCYFESPMRAFSTHNNVDFDTAYGASIVKVSNSECVSSGIDFDGSNLQFLVPIHIQNLDSNTEDLIIFDNVKVNGYINNQLSGTTISHKVICNTNNLKQTWNLAGSAKSITDNWNGLDVTWYPITKNEITSFKNMNAGSLARGKAVKRSGIGIDLFTSSDNVSDFLGILMNDVESGAIADVKFSGYLPWKYFDNPNYIIADGADVSVDSLGNFVQNSIHVVCKAVDNNNVLIN
jgi:hypothetical protein